ncbi:hypothetical protein LTR37_019855 [Vermiconidia calcicola]|uniref:Uncharacterized protein n=1 Tax=Vermiconidia calcicola TaxID=1690605 RepID=A0ACC3MES0_9PEZI|nr:hypothetical protein LTR37_019855 [Vermiconidia calcicola]
MSITSRTTHDQLRPCQRAYLGESNARRMLKRAQLTKKSEDDPIFALHEEAAAEAALAAAAAPFDITTPTGYSVQCYATHYEDEQKRKEAEAAEREKMVLFHSINSSRHAENTHPLRLTPLLCKFAQDHADMLFNEEHSGGSSNNVTNQVVVVMSPSGVRVARLVSQPGIGALACGEMWYGGKYKRHLYSITPENVGEHPEDCPCHLRIVFETMVDEGWNAVGIGKGEDGRWVVELGQ